MTRSARCRSIWERSSAASTTSSPSRGKPATSSRFAATPKQVKWIGRGMTRGGIKIVGNAGMHLGAYMKGGSIEVSGNVSDWLGGEMADGFIRVAGNAGGQVGAAYRGSRGGMRTAPSSSAERRASRSGCA